MKVNYIKNVYRYFQNNKIDFKKFKDNEVINMLTEIKGVGSWTAEMFLIFIYLERIYFQRKIYYQKKFREDIFSKKDHCTTQQYQKKL